MKKRVLGLLTVSLLIAGTPAWARNPVTVLVKGMVCDMCKAGLDKGFTEKKKTSLEDFKVDLTKHTITLIEKEGATITDAEIKEIVLGSSMEVDKITR